MVHCQGGSVQRHPCWGGQGILERNLGDIIQPSLPNQKTRRGFGCQWLPKRDLLPEFQDSVNTQQRL